MKLLTFFLCCFLFLNSCKECEEDVKIQFTNTDNEWLIYKLNQKITFVNQKGMLQNYVVTEINNIHRYYDKILPPLFSNECSQNYFTPRQEIVLTEENLNRSMKITFGKLKDGDKYVLSLYFHQSDCGQLSINEGEYNLYKKQLSNKDTIFVKPTSYPPPEIDEIILRKLHNLQTGKSYEYVVKWISRMVILKGQTTYYCSHNTNLFYSKEKGLVRFEFYNDSMNEVWELQE
jgi:hypothetical protein